MSNGIGERIAALLADRRETQADLARALDVKRQSVNKWMSGRSDPRKDIVAKIAEHFQVSPAWLAYGSEPGAYGDSIHLESGDVVIPVYDSEFSCGPGSEHSEFPQTARFMVVTLNGLGAMPAVPIAIRWHCSLVSEIQWLQRSEMGIWQSLILHRHGL